MPKSIKIINSNNNFNGEYGAIFGPKLSGSPRKPDYQGHVTDSPLHCKEKYKNFREVGLEVIVEKIKHMFMSHHRTQAKIAT